jgi:hypothetical protein
MRRILLLSHGNLELMIHTLLQEEIQQAECLENKNDSKTCH